MYTLPLYHFTVCRCSISECLLIVVQRKVQSLTNENKQDPREQIKLHRNPTLYHIDESVRKRYINATTRDDSQANCSTTVDSDNGNKTLRPDNKTTSRRKPVLTPRQSKPKRSMLGIAIAGTSELVPDSDPDSDSDAEVYSVHVETHLPRAESVNNQEEFLAPCIEDIRLYTGVLQTSINSRYKHRVHQCINTLIDYGVSVQVEAEPTTQTDSDIFRYTMYYRHYADEQLSAL